MRGKFDLFGRKRRRRNFTCHSSSAVGEGGGRPTNNHAAPPRLPTERLSWVGIPSCSCCAVALAIFLAIGEGGIQQYSK